VIVAGKLKTTRPTRRDAADAVRLKHAGDPAHINADEARLLSKLMPEAAGPVLTRGLLAEAGRRGDDRVTRLTPAEAALLRRSGGSGTRNPASGLMEFWGGGDDDGGMSGSEGNDSVGNGGMSGDSKAGDTMSGENSGGGDYFGIGRARTPAVESLLAAPNFREPGITFDQYAPPDTFGRLLDVFRMGPPRSYKTLGEVPGRYGAPTARGPGIVGTAINSFVGGPLGGPFGMAMGLGMKMDQAMSPESRAASMAENQAKGAENSGGNQGNHSVLDMDAKIAQLRGAEAAGSASGANTAATPPPGYTLNPAGQIVPMAGQSQVSAGLARSEDNRAAWKDPVENLLYDYIWRGPSGRGW
jgi:hypothetical protein